MPRETDRKVTFEIVRNIGVISRNDSGWTKELNIVKWNGLGPKYDIRDWDPDHEHMSRGITLREEDMGTVVDLYLADRDRAAGAEF